MQRNRSRMLKRITGFVLIIVGAWVMFYSTPIIAPSGLTLSTLTFTWMFVLFLALAASLFLDSGLRRYLKSLLIVFVLFIPWSLIMLIQLPDQLQLLLASFVALVGVLFYRRYYQKHKPQQTAHVEGIEVKQERTEPHQASYLKPTQEYLGKSSLLRKIVGGLLFITSGILFFTLFPFVLLFIGLFRGWLVSIPILLLMTVGYFLFTNRKLKTAIPTWIGILLLTLLPYIFLIPLVYQILSICILALAFMSALYWYRSRCFKSKGKATKQDENTSS